MDDGRSGVRGAFPLRLILGGLFIAHLYWKFVLIPGGVAVWWANLLKAGYPPIVPAYVLSAEIAGALLLIPGGAGPLCGAVCCAHDGRSCAVLDRAEGILLHGRRGRASAGLAGAADPPGPHGRPCPRARAIAGLPALAARLGVMAKGR